MTRLAMLIIVCLTIAPIVTISKASGGGPTKENALAAEQELGQAMLANDADRVCRWLDPGWAVVTGNGDIGDGDGMRDGFCAAIKSGNFTRKTYEMDLANARVRLYGNIATVTVKLSVSGTFQHKAFAVKEVQTDVLKWEDGGWKSVLTHETNVRGTLVTN
jgi:ketosteroid isomerase-like protein